MRTPLGAMLRAVVRRGSGFGMMVLEVAFGMAVVAQCLSLMSWFLDHAATLGLPAAEVLQVDVVRTSTAADRAQEDHAALRALPGVRALAQVEQAPFAMPEAHVSLTTPGRTEPDAVAWMVRGSVGVDEVLGVQVIAGRGLRDEDLGRPRGVLITASLAHLLLPDRDPLGQPLLIRDQHEPLEVVGVIADIATASGMAPVRTQVLIRPQALAAPWSSTRWLVRFDGPRPALGELRRGLAALHPTAVAAVSLEALRAHLDTALSTAQVVLLVVVKVVASVTLLGSLGMAAFLVHGRRRQVAIMRALGATRGDVARYFLLENVMVTSVGVLLGVVISYGLHLIALRYEPTLELHVGHVVLGALLFWGVGLLAAWSPAHAAARIPPGAQR